MAFGGLWPSLRHKYRYHRLPGSSYLTSQSHGPLWILVVVSVVYCLVLVISQQSTQRDPTSWFFNPDKGYAPIYTNLRRQQADNFIDSIAWKTPGSSVKFHPDESSRGLCLGIGTFARHNVRYFRTTVGSLLEGLDDSERQRIFLILFIAHTDPTVHPAFSESWVEEIADRVLVYNLTEPSLDHIKSLEAQGAPFLEKPLFDYTYLLKACQETGLPYTAIIEDDVIAMDSWFHRTNQALAEVEKQSALKYGTMDYLYLRLFYTEEFLGWNSEEWPTYLLVSLLVFTLLTGALLVTRSFSRVFRNNSSNFKIIGACSISIPLCILLYFASGRAPNFSLHSRVVEMNEFGCCSQGFVFSREMVPKTIGWLEAKKIGFVDMLMEVYGDVSGYSRWTMMPSILQHVGQLTSKFDTKDQATSLEKERSAAETIWNFGFELNDAELLRREHDEHIIDK